jgi:hypothetical protein
LPQLCRYRFFSAGNGNPRVAFYNPEDPMKAYVITTAVVFFALAILHIARLVQEGPHLLTELFFVITTGAAAAFAIGRRGY